MAKLIDIEGIGPKYAALLEKAGFKTQEKLLKICCAKKERKALADKTGINEKLILEWVNRADLCRIKGVSTQYSDLLECAGVDSVPELKMRKPENLHAKMKEVNDAKNLVRQLPSVKQVTAWVAQAKTMDKVVTH